MAWSGFNSPERPLGYIAGGLEDGTLHLWDADRLVKDGNGENSLVLKKNHHSANLRALDFNPSTTNLLASGAVNGDVSLKLMNSTTFRQDFY